MVFMLRLASLVRGTARSASSDNLDLPSISNGATRVNRIRQAREKIFNYFFGPSFFLFVKPQDVGVGMGYTPVFWGLTQHADWVV
jgi:hypothetical protein